MILIKCIEYIDKVGPTVLNTDFTNFSKIEPERLIEVRICQSYNVEGGWYYNMVHNT